MLECNRSGGPRISGIGATPVYATVPSATVAAAPRLTVNETDAGPVPAQVAQQDWDASAGAALCGAVPANGAATEVDCAAEPEQHRTLFAGGATTCAMMHSNRTLCWGDPLYRRNNRSPSRSPAPLQPEWSLASVAFTNGHACGVRTDRTVACWGENSHGPIGDGSFINRNVPTSVVSIRDVTQVSVGYHISCALTLRGDVFCWGANYRRQLGQLAASEHSAVPVQVRGIRHATAVTCGGGHSCALLASGHVSCWGANDVGQIGNGTFSVSENATLVSTISNAVAVSAEASHTCALLANRTVRCWGAIAPPIATADQNLDAGGFSTPFEVHGIHDAVGISVGSTYACVLRSTGNVLCWGDNLLGQCGVDTITGPSSLVSVAGVSDAVEIAGGFSHTCALLRSGNIICWGSNRGRQISPNDVEFFSRPTLVTSTR